MKNRQRGFTLIELLIVVAIIGIIAAIAVPNLLNAMDRGKQRRTMADMRAIGQALEQYQIDLNYYPHPSPGSKQNIDAVVKGYLEGPGYLTRVPDKDGWGWPIIYGTVADGTGTRGISYTLRSPGKDGQTGTSFGETTEFDCDIVYTDGSFTAIPTGPQR